MSVIITKEKSISIDYNESEVYSIVQSNRLIKSQYLLSTNEHKLLESIISMINPTAEYKKNEDDIYFTVSLSRSQISELTGIANKNLPKFLLAAAEKFDQYNVTDIKKNGVDFERFRLISYSSYMDGVFTVKFTSEASEELYNLADKRYTKYLHENLMKLKNKYAIRLYRQVHSLLAPRANQSEIKFDLGDLWFYLGLVSEKGEIFNPRYTKTFSEFKTRVLEKALQDISVNTELDIKLSRTKREGRSIKWIYLDVSRKRANNIYPVLDDGLLNSLISIGIKAPRALNILDDGNYTRGEIQNNFVYLVSIINEGFIVREPEKMLKALLKYDYASLPELANPYSTMYRDNRNKQRFLKERIIPVWRDLSDSLKQDFTLEGLEADFIHLEYKGWLDKKDTKDMFV
jgi:plasmid replication initiation protein